MSWGWVSARQATGVPDLLFHDLRCTAVRNLRRTGVAEPVIMKITGHRTRGVFERYTITDQRDAPKPRSSRRNSAALTPASRHKSRPN